MDASSIPIFHSVLMTENKQTYIPKKPRANESCPDACIFASLGKEKSTVEAADCGMVTGFGHCYLVGQKVGNVMKYFCLSELSH